MIKSQNTSLKRQYFDTWRVLTRNHPAGTILTKHQHSRGQLVFAISGVMQVETNHGHWIIPPQRAVWVPPNEPHSIKMLSNTDMRTVYFEQSLIAQCAEITNKNNRVYAIRTSPLIKELVLGLFDSARDSDMHGIMALLLLYALAEAEVLPTYLPMPKDVRFENALVILIDKKQWRRSLEEVASSVMMSSRSFSRHFSKDVGMSFRTWRQHARILASLDLLKTKHSVKFVAHSMGFSSSAAYSAAFRNLFDCTPNEF